MRLTKKEKEFMFDIMDRLTDKTHYAEINDKQANEIAWPLFKKLRMELKGY